MQWDGKSSESHFLFGSFPADLRAVRVDFWRL